VRRLRSITRPPVAGRRRPPRTGIGTLVTWARVLGGVMIVLSAAGVVWLVNAGTFRLDPDRLEVRGLRHTTPEVARLTMGLAEGATPNLFRLRTSDMERALADLPAVAEAEVSAILPDRLVVQVTERQPVFVLRTPDDSYLVDPAGVLLIDASEADPGLASLPLVDDWRSDAGREPVVGGAMEPVDLAAVLQLAAVTPDLLGSSAGRLTLAITDQDGFVMTTEPATWRAVFGHYTPTLRPPDRIAQQVQCLRSLLAEGESELRTVYLEPVGDRCGTFAGRPSPVRATPSPEPSG
jgi:cell division septal protein FtsQ